MAQGQEIGYVRYIVLMLLATLIGIGIGMCAFVTFFAWAFGA